MMRFVIETALDGPDCSRPDCNPPMKIDDARIKLKCIYAPIKLCETTGHSSVLCVGSLFHMMEGKRADSAFETRCPPTQPNLVDDAQLECTASPKLFPLGAAGKLRQFLGCTVGGFLLLAVLLKLQAIVPDAYYFGILGPIPLALVAICAQAFVAVALLRHSDQPLSWALAAVLFLCLFAVAIEKSVTGLSDCGCFGVVRSNARTTAIIDGVFLAFCASIWWSRIRRPAMNSSFANCINQMKNALAGSAAFLIVGLTAVAIFTIAGLGSANGTPTLQVPISPLTVQSIDDASRMFIVRLPFHNRSRASVRIIGFSSGCSGKCSTALPIKIEPGETATLEIHSRFAMGTRNGVVSVPLFTSDTGKLMNRVRFVAQR